MAKTLTLSIVIPAHNEEGHLKACLESVARQTVKPLQVIVVDNNSTDETAAIARLFPFVTLLRESKQGIAHARNRGFDAVRADIIGRIDADSRLPEDWVAHAIDYLRDHPKELLTGGGYFYDLGAPRFTGWVMSQWAFRMNRFVMGHYIAWGSNMVMRRELWRAVRGTGLHNRSDIHEDMDLSIHLHELGYVITYQAWWKVGAASRIADRHHRGVQMEWLKMWPRTFRVHGLPRAWLGDIGVYIVYFSWYPALVIDRVARAGTWMRRWVRGLRR